MLDMQEQMQEGFAHISRQMLSLSEPKLFNQK